MFQPDAYFAVIGFRCWNVAYGKNRFSRAVAFVEGCTHRFTSLEEA